MIQKPSITIGILPDGQAQVLEVGDADLCKQAFVSERANPSGKYTDVMVYRKPPFWKRAKLPKAAKKSSRKKA